MTIEQERGRHFGAKTSTLKGLDFLFIPLFLALLQSSALVVGAVGDAVIVEIPFRR